MILLFIISSLVVGCAISSFFGRRKDEKYYIFRTYQLYEEGKVDLMTVILGAVLNTIIGAVPVGILAFKMFF